MHTPAPIVDITASVPALMPLARTATRLHPRPGSPDADSSHVGGPVRWPADQPWPMCTADLPGEDEVSVPQLYGGFLAVRKPPGIGARPLPHPQLNPMIVVAQLKVADVPGLWHPAGVDTLQLLWCPFDHPQDHGHTPVMRLWWRTTDRAWPVAQPPSGLADDRFYVPTACVFHPEQVTEYPDVEDLPAELAAQVAALGEDVDYSGELSTAPGWKIGGWPQWSVTGRYPMDCAHCGAEMELLLTIDTNEFDSGRWQPTGDHEASDGEQGRQPTRIVVGRWGSLQIFICTHCPDHPTRLNLQ